MRRFKFLCAALAVAAIATVTPLAHAQKQACLNAGSGTAASCLVHVVGAGSSAQFLTAALGADQLAINEITAESLTGTQCPYHWTAKNSAYMIDARSSTIPNELGNIWIVWVAACSDITGNTNITDLWTDVSQDSTVGNRSFFAQQSGGNWPSFAGGDQLQVIPAASGGLVSPATLWPDNNPDVATLLSGGATNIPGAIGTASNGSANVRINVGMTDIRPEDAYFATSRAFGALDTTNWTGLGYNFGPISNQVGGGIKSAQSSVVFTPVAFELAGGTDPISLRKVRSATTVPVGAAPIIFAFNNGNTAYNTPNAFPEDLKTGIVPVSAGGPYLLANLYDGTTACNATNPAFDAFSAGTPSSANYNLLQREPLSGTMNTTEFNLFRTYGDPDDSQEKGVDNPQVSTYNPLNGLPCASGGGRYRAIGTGEMVSAIKGGATTAPANNSNQLGYFFWGFANAAKLAGAGYNYLTLDGVDPLFASPSAAMTCQGGTAPNNDGASCGTAEPCTAGSGGTAGTCSATATPYELPDCTSAVCTEDLFNGPSFPNLRNGTYKAWSLYRWVVESATDYCPGSSCDDYGPAHLVTSTENVINTSVTDYVPFSTATDSLDVYRTHLIRTTLPATTPNDGSISGYGVNPTYGTTLGGGTEAGGDMGGYVIGPATQLGTYANYWCPGFEHVNLKKNTNTIKLFFGPLFTTKYGKPYPNGYGSLNLVAGNIIRIGNGTTQHPYTELSIESVKANGQQLTTYGYVPYTQNNDSTMCFAYPQQPGPLGFPN